MFVCRLSRKNIRTFKCYRRYRACGIQNMAITKDSHDRISGGYVEYHRSVSGQTDLFPFWFRSFEQQA